MSLFGERLRIDGKHADADVRLRTTSARLVRTMEGGSSVVLVVSDHDMKLLRSDVLTKPGEKRDKLTQASWSRFGRSRLTLDGAFFRLAGAEGQYDEESRQLTLTFEDEVWSLLDRYKGPLKAARSGGGGKRGVTRAQFIARLVREVRPRPAYLIPELSEDQPVRGGKSSKRRNGERDKGFATGAPVTVKGHRADAEQRRNYETVLAVADEAGAGELATLALLMACIQESGVRDLPYGDKDSQGILQLRTSIHGVELARDVAGSARAFLMRGYWGKGGAIALASSNPNQGPGWIAQQVQGSGHPDAYDQWRSEAEDVLAAWGGAGRAMLGSSKYEYRRLGGKGDDDESSAECIRRLADEVRWRAWSDENIFHLVTDPWLFQNRPITTIRPRMRGLSSMSFTADVGMPVAEVRLAARVERWDGAPGDCVLLEGFGGLDGRWLTWELEHDLFTEDTTITLRRPRPPLPEPPASQDPGVDGTVTSDGGARGIVDQAVSIAQQFGDNVFVVSAHRPGDPLDHGGNDDYKAARDIAVHGFDAHVGPPQPELDRACVAIGASFGRSYGLRDTIIDTFHWQGFRVQIIWRTPKYGGHEGHIHIGVRRA